MNYLTERNERRSRQSAIVMAILLHLGLIAAIYLATATPYSAPQTPAHPALKPLPTSDGRTATR